jgi:hypothetical protein
MLWWWNEKNPWIQFHSNWHKLSLLLYHWRLAKSSSRLPVGTDIYRPTWKGQINARNSNGSNSRHAQIPATWFRSTLFSLHSAWLYLFLFLLMSWVPFSGSLWLLYQSPLDFLVLATSPMNMPPQRRRKSERQPRREKKGERMVELRMLWCERFSWIQAPTSPG